MQYTKYTISITSKPEDLSHDDLFALLSDHLASIGFDSFEEDGEQLLAYIPCERDADGLLAGLELELPITEIQLGYQSEVMPDINWNEEWEKNYFSPIVIGEGLCLIRAPFHTPSHDVKTEVIINPKMAFGTGNHETTALVVRYILNHAVEGLRVLDMGCGTGILGILALKLGASHLTAIDIDEWAFHNIVENATLNGVHQLEALQGDASILLGREPYDLILANITRNILLEDMPAYVSVLNPQGTLVLSGFYEEDTPLLLERANALGLSLIEKCVQNKWTLLALRQ